VSDANQTILIVEDDGDVRRLFCLALKLEGFGVVEAADGYEALLKLESHRIDLMVLDLYLPRIGGLWFSRKSNRAQRSTVSLSLS
jgi:DNA-binding response OmpR family regulator